MPAPPGWVGLVHTRVGESRRQHYVKARHAVELDLAQREVRPASRDLTTLRIGELVETWCGVVTPWVPEGRMTRQCKNCLTMHGVVEEARAGVENQLRRFPIVSAHEPADVLAQVRAAAEAKGLNVGQVAFSEDGRSVRIHATARVPG